MGRGASKAGGKGGGSLKNPKDFKSQQEAEEYFEKTGFIDSLSQDERKGIVTYTGAAFETINDSLRGKRKMADDTQKVIDQIDAGIAKSILKEPVTVYRNVHGMAFGLNGKPPTEAALKELIGGEFVEKGYTSTSAGKNVFGSSDKVLLKINVPSGIGFGGYVAPISQFHSESEFLIKRNTTYRIKGLTTVTDHNGTHTALEIDVVK